MPKTRRYAWVRAEIMIVRQCAGTMTALQIAALIGRTDTAVRCKAAELGVSLRLHGDRHQSARYRQEDIELARQMHAAGISRHDIAEKLEMPRGAVKQFIYFERRI